MKITKPDDFAHYEIGQDGNTLTVTPSPGSTLSRAISKSLELAQLNPKAEVVLEFNATKVHLNAGDTIGVVEARYNETQNRQNEAFLASPEGQESQREQERQHEVSTKRQAKARRLLKELSTKSLFRFPSDMPSITGMGRELDLNQAYSPLSA